MGFDDTDVGRAIKTAFMVSKKESSSKGTSLKHSQILVFQQVPCWILWSRVFSLLINDTDRHFSGPRHLSQREKSTLTRSISYIHGLKIIIRSVLLVI